MHEGALHEALKDADKLIKMRLLFVLSREDLRLAAEEISALSGKRCVRHDDVLLCSTDERWFFKRPAYARSVHRLLFSCSQKDLKHRLEGFAWQSVCKGSFSVRTMGKLLLTERDAAAYVWKGLRNPIVDLKEAETQVFLIESGAVAYCTILLERIYQDFNSRKAHLRRELHPSSLHPKLARAMVNLTGIRRGRLHDPFCGSGGILIEAGLAGLLPVGYDIDPVMIRRAEANMKQQGIAKSMLKLQDACMISHKMAYVATDLPYGRNTKQQDFKRLYSAFIAVLGKRLGRRAVVSFPNGFDAKWLVRRSGLRIENQFTYYLHKSLSKRILVLGVA